MQIEDFLKSYQQNIKPLADNFFNQWQKKAIKAGDIPEELIVKIAQLFPKGKQVRGALTVLGYELAGGKVNPDIYQASIMIELLHTAALVADDVFDWDDLRRGQKTIHRKWQNYFASKNEKYGLDMAFTSVMMSMYLSPLTFEGTGFKPEITLKAWNYFFKKVIDTCWGEALDISSPFLSFRQKKDSVEIIHQYKTIEYTGVLPLVFGSILAGNKNLKWQKDLENYGRILGQIFQIQDDVIGSFGKTKISGKANISDIKEARWTYLIQSLYIQALVSDKKLLEKIFLKKERKAEDITKIKNLMITYQVLEKVEADVQRLLNKGKALVGKITKNQKHQQVLLDLLKYVGSRNK